MAPRENHEKTFIWQTNAWPRLTYDVSALQSAFERVTGRAGALAGLRQGLSESDRFDTMVREISAEGVHSFAIEGETLDPQRMTQSLIASLKVRDIKAAAGVYRGVAEVMLDARDGSRPLTLGRLHGWHAQLFKQDPSMQDIGQLRSEPMQVVTVKRGEVREVYFEAPPPERLADDMRTFLQWVERTSPAAPEADLHSTPGRAALGHLWFETIHPYIDGNGRLGRAVADFIASQSPLFCDAPFSLSRAIQEDKKQYYDALQRAQSTRPKDDVLDVSPFVAWFAQAMERGIELASEEAHYIHRRNQFFAKHEGQLNPRQDQALRRIFEEGPERLTLGLSSKPYQRITGASAATATRDLNDLAEKGILRWTGQRGRSTAYEIVI